MMSNVLFLSNEVKGNTRIDQEQPEAAVVEELSRFPGVSLAVSSAVLRKGKLPETATMRAVINNVRARLASR